MYKQTLSNENPAFNKKFSNNMHLFIPFKLLFFKCSKICLTVKNNVTSIKKIIFKTKNIYGEVLCLEKVFCWKEQKIFSIGLKSYVQT